MRQQAFGQVVQVPYLFTPTDFTCDFTGAEIFWLPSELCDFIEPRRVLQEAVEGLSMRPIEPMGDDGGHPFLLVRQRLTDSVLHKAVAGSNDALLFQRVHELSEDKNGLC